MSTEIVHDRAVVDQLLRIMDEAKNAGLKLENTLESLSTAIEGNFSGEATESLVLLLDHEVKRIRLEKDNWNEMYQSAETVAAGIEYQDETLVCIVR